MFLTNSDNITHISSINIDLSTIRSATALLQTKIFGVIIKNLYILKLKIAL